MGVSDGWAVGLDQRQTHTADTGIALCGLPGWQEGGGVPKSRRVFDHENGVWWEGGVRGDAGTEGRTPRCDTPWALHWLQFTLIHLMFKCKTSYAIMSGCFFLLF